MFLTSEIPTSWIDLQDKVCEYLVQAGYHAETAKTIDTVRGKVEVDVYATAEDEMLKQFICECKYWDSAVPKEKYMLLELLFRIQVLCLAFLYQSRDINQGQ